MKQFYHFLTCCLLCVFLVSGMCISSNAAKEEDDAEDINGATITVTSNIESEEGTSTLEVTASSNRFFVDSYAFLGGEGSWRPGEVPKATVVLRAEDGYQFSVKIKSDKITVKGGDCTALKRLESGQAVELTLRLKPVKGTLGSIEDAYWVSSTVGKAKWDKAEFAMAYQLRLYCNNTLIKTIDKTTTNTFDFYPYMTKVGVYTFRVRAVPRNANETSYLSAGEWQYSDEVYLERTQVSNGENQNNQSSGQKEPGESSSTSQNPDHPPFGWVRDGNGWWYHENDGSYPVNRWSYIDNKWYLFDMAGYMRTGWHKWNDKYYYMTVNGEMVTGWLEDNKRWYFLNADGVMQIGWLQVNGQWFYLMTDGARATDWHLIGKSWYYFYPDTGVMATDTVIGNYQVSGDGSRTQ